MDTSNHDGRQPKGSDQLSLDTCFDMLAEERRQCVIQYLQEEPSPVALADLARQIADCESEKTPTAPPDLQDAVYCSLYHWHIPALADADVIAHNREQNTVEPAANFSGITRVWSVVSVVPELKNA